MINFLMVAAGAREAEVSDLIARLRALVKDPTSRWSGIEVSFSGSDVQIRLSDREDNNEQA